MSTTRRTDPEPEPFDRRNDLPARLVGHAVELAPLALGETYLQTGSLATVAVAAALICVVVAVGLIICSHRR